jgi:hypothetical protein
VLPVQGAERQLPQHIRSLASLSALVAPRLADAQHVIARDYGFASWPKLKEHVEAATRMLQPMELLSAAVRASDANKVSRVLEQHPELKAQINEPMTNYGPGAQALLAAVQRSDRNTIDGLLRAGADINARSRRHRPLPRRERPNPAALRFDH